MRVTDEIINKFLGWGRNYGEIESFSKIADSGRKWLIKMPGGLTITASNAEPGILEQNIIPDEIVFTNREALAFGMGLAVAGARSETRAEHARREWSW